MAVQDIASDKGMAFLDPHGGTAELLLEYIPEHRRKDVVYFAPFDSDYPISFNVMESVDNADQRSKIANGLMSVFKKIWVDSFSARMEYIMSNSILALLETPGTTLLGLNRILVDKEYRKMVISNITDASVKSFWVDEYLKWDEKYAREAGAAIQNKIGQFTSNPIIRNIVGQAENALDIRKIMDEGKILICNLSKGRLGEQNARLIGGMLNTKIYQAAMSRAEMSRDEIAEAKEFYLYVDEFQNFASDSFADVLSEARKYKLSLTIAHQYIAQMPENVRDAIFGNCGTLISFRIGPVDAEVMSQQFAPVFEPEDFANLGRFQIYLRLLVDRVGTRPFSAGTLAPIEKPDVSVKDEVIANSRELYGRPKEIVEANITKWFEPVMTKEREDHLKYVAEKKAETESRGGVWVDYNDPKYKGMSKEAIKSQVEEEMREKKRKQKEALKKAKERAASPEAVIEVQEIKPEGTAEVVEKKASLFFDEPPIPTDPFERSIRAPSPKRFAFDAPPAPPAPTSVTVAKEAVVIPVPLAPSGGAPALVVIPSPPATPIAIPVPVAGGTGKGVLFNPPAAPIVKGESAAELEIQKDPTSTIASAPVLKTVFSEEVKPKEVSLVEDPALIVPVKKPKTSQVKLNPIKTEVKVGIEKKYPEVSNGSKSVVAKKPMEVNVAKPLVQKSKAPEINKAPEVIAPEAEEDDDFEIVIMDTEYVPPEEPKPKKKWDKSKKKKKTPDKNAYDVGDKRFRVSRPTAPEEENADRRLSDSEIETQVLELQKKRAQERGYDESEALLERIQGSVQAKLNPKPAPKAVKSKVLVKKTPAKKPLKYSDPKKKNAAKRVVEAVKKSPSSEPRKKSLPANKKSRDREAPTELKALLAKVASEPSIKLRPISRFPKVSSSAVSSASSAWEKPNAMSFSVKSSGLLESQKVNALPVRPAVLPEIENTESRPRLSNAFDGDARRETSRPIQTKSTPKREVPEDLLKSILE
jgi:hypothetical protein